MLKWPKEIQDRLIIGDKLGAGYFAEVRFALDRKNGEDVAVKIIDRLKCRGKENMIEAEIRNDSRNPLDVLNFRTYDSYN